jgi:hypothetical protein
MSSSMQASEVADSSLPTGQSGRHHTEIRKDSSFHLNTCDSSTGTMETIEEGNQQ